jgi:hypothetical protein
MVSLARVARGVRFTVVLSVETGGLLTVHLLAEHGVSGGGG